MNGAILFPKQHQRDARLLQLQRQIRPVRLRQPAQALLHPGAGEQPVLQRVVGQVAWQRPDRRRRALQIVLHGAARDAQPLCDLAGAGSITGKPQHLS